MTLKSLSGTAGDIMSSPPVVISRGSTLLDAARVMVERNIGCVPVVDNMGRFAGMITERTFQVEMAGVKPSSALPPDRRVLEQLFIDGASGMTSIQETFLAGKVTPVEEAMLVNEPSLKRSTPVWQVAEAFLKSHLSHLVVLEDGKPVGVVARHDLLRAYMNDAPGS
jgi:CBS domain-containing protein